MSTFENKKIVDEIIAGNGYDGEPGYVWLKVVEYTTPEGNTVWGCVHNRDRNPDRYEQETFYVRNPKVIWERR